MQFRYLAFSQCGQANAGELQALVYRGDVLLVAADTVQCLGKQDVEDARVASFKEGLNAGPVVQRAPAEGP